MIHFTPKTTKYERSPSRTSLNTWNVSHIISGTFSWRFSVCAASNHTIVYVKRGEFDFTCFHKKEKISEYQVLCIAPSQTFSIRPLIPQECELYIIEFDCNFFPFFELSNYVITEFKNSDENIFREIENAYNIGEQDYVVDSYLIQILNLIKKNFTKSLNQNDLTLRIQTYVREHSNEKLTTTKIANVFGYNKDYLVRLLKKSGNLSLKELIIEERLRIVKNLLSFTDFPIAKIGKQIGFDDPNDFHKFFKYHVQMTPAAYRISRQK